MAQSVWESSRTSGDPPELFSEFDKVALCILYKTNSALKLSAIERVGFGSHEDLRSAGFEFRQCAINTIGREAQMSKASSAEVLCEGGVWSKTSAVGVSGHDLDKPNTIQCEIGEALAI